jgi:N-acetyl-gamma-glutamyl-phosphate reductase
MKHVFIDGSAGTTGLRIRERLAERTDIELIALPEAFRKDENARREALSSADIAFLCLPDDAARDAVGMIQNPDTVVIDTSTAHRTAPDFAYGFPELSPEFEEKIKKSKRIAVPGCHASGFIALVYPLIKSGILPKTARLTCHSVTGYSGGGKKMIADYESEKRSPLLSAPRQYALTQEHKHLKEMKALTGLLEAPIFCPIVADFYSGMVVTVPLFAGDLAGGMADIKEIYRKSYNTAIVRYKESPDEAGFLSAAGLSGRDSMEISVLGNEERILLVARYDNLGKGASGAAVECLNLVMNCDKTAGLVL